MLREHGSDSRATYSSVLVVSAPAECACGDLDREGAHVVDVENNSLLVAILGGFEVTGPVLIFVAGTSRSLNGLSKVASLVTGTAATREAAPRRRAMNFILFVRRDVLWEHGE